MSAFKWKSQVKRIIIFLFIFFVTCIHAGHADPVSVQEAKQVAVNWIHEKWGRPLAKTKAGADVLDLVESTSAYHVLNLPDGGWIIIAADDIAHPVIAFSYMGTYSMENHPVQFNEWMENVRREISAAVSQSQQPTTKNKKTWEYFDVNPADFSPKQLRLSSVAPLLTTTWDQGQYYNTSCPVDYQGADGHAYVGCVAVAMGQVMKYHNHPTKGVGSHSYSDPHYGTQSANFGATTYYWSSMPNALYNYNSAVATLLYHVGVSLNMEYHGTEGSEANDTDVPYALKTYFKYNPSVHYSYRSSYTTSEWEALIRTELNNHRPVIYGGYGSGGHAFVCDGFSGSDYFHFNWGWGGHEDGYFYLNDLTPGGDNFNYNQGAVIGAQPLDIYEPDNNASQARDITINSNQLHSIDPANDTDWTKFTIQSSQCVEVKTSGSSGDTRMWLYRSNLQLVQFDDDSGSNLFSKIVEKKLPAGTYFVKVDEYNNDNEISSYTLSLKSCNSPWALFLPAILSASSKIPGTSCGSGKVYDCARKCVSSSTAQSWIGDGYCDNGFFGIDLLCAAFQYDAGDCN